MSVLNLKQMKLNEPTRNFDESVDANVNIPAENNQGLFGAFKFFSGIRSFFKGISALGTLASGSRLPVTDSNGNVTYTTMNDINSYVINNALTKYTKFANRNTESITDANDLPEGNYVANNLTNGLAGWTSYFTTKVDNNNAYKLQYAISNVGYMKFRRCNGGTWLDWDQLATVTNLSEYAKQTNIPIKNNSKTFMVTAYNPIITLTSNYGDQFVFFVNPWKEGITVIMGTKPTEITITHNLYSYDVTIASSHASKEFFISNH